MFRTEAEAKADALRVYKCLTRSPILDLRGNGIEWHTVVDDLGMGACQHYAGGAGSVMYEVLFVPEFSCRLGDFRAESCGETGFGSTPQEAVKNVDKALDDIQIRKNKLEALEAFYRGPDCTEYVLLQEDNFRVPKVDDLWVRLNGIVAKDDGSRLDCNPQHREERWKGRRLIVRRVTVQQNQVSCCDQLKELQRVITLDSSVLSGNDLVGLMCTLGAAHDKVGVVTRYESKHAKPYKTGQGFTQCYTHAQALSYAQIEMYKHRLLEKLNAQQSKR